MLLNDGTVLEMNVLLFCVLLAHLLVVIVEQLVHIVSCGFDGGFFFVGGAMLTTDCLSFGN